MTHPETYLKPSSVPALAVACVLVMVAAAVATLGGAALLFLALLGPAWFWHGKVLRLTVHREGDMKLWDRFVPLLEKMEARFPVPAGLSLVAIAEKPVAIDP